MPVYASDLKLYGSAEMPDNDTDPNGGAIDTGNEITGTVGEVFTGAYSEEAGGSTYIQYRKVFYRNSSTTSELHEVKIWVSADPQDHIEMALEDVINGNDESANRLTAPVGPVFAKAHSEGAALDVPGTGILEPGDAIGVWLKLTILAGQSPIDNVLTQYAIKGKSTE